MPSRDWDEPPRRGHLTWKARFPCPHCPSFRFQSQRLLDAHLRQFHARKG